MIRWGKAPTVPEFAAGAIGEAIRRRGTEWRRWRSVFAGPKNKPMLLNSLYGSVQGKADPIAAYLTSFQKCYVDLPRLLKPEVWEKVKNAPSVFAEELQQTETTFLNRLMRLNIEFKGADYILTKVNNLTAAAAAKTRSPPIRCADGGTEFANSPTIQAFGRAGKSGSQSCCGGFAARCHCDPSEKRDGDVDAAVVFEGLAAASAIVVAESSCGDRAFLRSNTNPRVAKLSWRSFSPLWTEAVVAVGDAGNLVTSKSPLVTPN